MGTLDDAIREHLELKRSKGASEDEIKRKEAEAFGRGRQHQPHEPAAEDPPPRPAEHHPASEPDLSHIGGQNGASSQPQDGTGYELYETEHAPDSDHERHEPDEVLPADSLEPELPPTSEPPITELSGSSEPPPPVPDVKDRGGADRTEAWSDPEGDEAEEDVLEETPEFLEDTPEHDRLWFEQKPPKDFDFD
jgi:hypothetical protein